MTTKELQKLANKVKSRKEFFEKYHDLYYEAAEKNILNVLFEKHPNMGYTEFFPENINKNDIE